MSRFIRTMPGPANELVFATVGRVPLTVAHDAMLADRVKRELHGAQDDVGEWAHAHWNTLRAGLADARMQAMADEERQRVVQQSVEHFAQCRGMSCRQGRLPCRERCGAEMATYEPAGEDPLPNPWWTPNGAMAAAAIGFVAFCGWVGYWLLPL